MNRYRKLIAAFIGFLTLLLTHLGMDEGQAKGVIELIEMALTLAAVYWFPNEPEPTSLTAEANKG